MPSQLVRPIPVTGTPPSAPQTVTSTTKDAAATVAWYAPSSSGSSSITHYVITPYVGATAQSATTVAVGSVTSLSDSYGGTALKTDVTGLTNSTAYTFTVKARSAVGDSAESAASGANTPFAGLVFGDDFNGPTGAAPDPEWWVYDRCGYLAQSEVQWYKPDHCVLDGTGNLKLTAEKLDTSGPRYPSDPSYPGTVTQAWRSGACQGNTRLFYPGTAGNSMTFETRCQVSTFSGENQYWPGLFWLMGQTHLNGWKTDPDQPGGWTTTGGAEIDVAEWQNTGGPDTYLSNTSTTGSWVDTHSLTGSGLATSMHTYSAVWKPGVNVKFYRDGALAVTASTEVPVTGAQFFLLLYFQMRSGARTDTQSVYVDYVRVYDQNLG